MDVIKISIATIPIVIYLIMLLWIKRFITKKIPNKIKREKFKKDNNLREVLNDLFAPFFVLSFIIGSIESE